MSILITSDYMQGSIARCIPGAYFDRDCDPKGWYLNEPTPRAATVALKLFPTLATDYPVLADLRDSLASDVRPYGHADRLQIPVEAPGCHYQLKRRGFDWYPYQNYDLGYGTAILEQYGSLYVGWERGLGKTLAACALMEATHAKRVLVVCPNTAKGSVWEPEIAQWLGWQTVVLRNPKSQREKDLAALVQLHQYQPDDPLIFVVHYEALDIIGGDNKRGWKKLGIDWDMIVCDEAHRLANTKIKLHKALMKIPTKHKVALSGSVISNHAEELFGQIRWLFPDRYRSKWRDWNDRYLDYVDGRWGRICVGVKPERLQELQEELGVFMLYRRSKDCLDLPPRSEQSLYVSLSESQRRVYNALIEDAMAELPSGEVLKAADGLSLLGRLRQVASGISLVSSDEIADSSKLDLAQSLIEEDEDEPYVVMTWYKKSAYELAARLEAKGIGCHVVTGDMPQAQRPAEIEAFQNGSGRVFIGTMRTIGESVTLHRASHLIMLDRSWNPTHNDQAMDRIHRIGQTRPTFIAHIIAQGTVDEYRVTPVINDKAALRRMILGG